MITSLLVLGVLWLAWSNGANDNFKGVATLYGSRSLTYRTALVLAGGATLAGGLVAVELAGGLVKAFSGAGLVDGGPLSQVTLTSAGLAAGATIALATLLGLPTSTTHALLGALIGAVGVLAPGSIRGGNLLSKFVQPLLWSPLLAAGVAAALCGLLRVRRGRGLGVPSCLCVGESAPVPAGSGRAAMTVAAPGLVCKVGTVEACEQELGDRSLRLDAALATKGLHLASAGAVCFARAVNDAPKIGALALSTGALGVATGPHVWVAVVTMAMVLGGIIQGRRVALTMGDRIASLNEGNGLTANLVTSTLVLGASSLGLPVSTTHVSCGAIFGVGAANGGTDRRILKRILLAWVTTLPLGLALGAGLRLALRALGV